VCLLDIKCIQQCPAVLGMFRDRDWSVDPDASVLPPLSPGVRIVRIACGDQGLT
jgi:hypothetical protein